jgi:5-methylcytosine-specific restriction endonuclease McrA
LVLDLMHDPATTRKVPRFKKDGTRHKVDRTEHLCAECGNWVFTSQISVDHVVPVIDPEIGFVDFNTYVSRMFCGRSNLKKKCDACHQAKTNAERFQKNLRIERAELERAETFPDIAKKFLKKYNAKRWTKFPYPQEFKNRVEALRVKLSVK